MGDRTTLYLEILKSTRDHVVRVFGEPAEEHPSEHGSSATSLVFDEVPGGGLDTLEELSRSGLAFLARHDEGNEYGGATFAAFDGTLAEVSSPRGTLMVAIDPHTLAPYPDETMGLRRWRKTYDSVVALIEAAASHLAPTQQGDPGVHRRTVRKRRRRRARHGRS